MKAKLVICLLTTAVYGLPEVPKDVPSYLENRIVGTRAGGTESDVTVKGIFIIPEIGFNGKKKWKTTPHTAKDDDGKVWIFLVAGSMGWKNYRHQADLCHAYQLLLLRGVPRENIIVMMRDDIATNLQNPYQGKIMNDPYGTDVYEGVIIDYRGDDVTPENFIKVLEGNKKAMEGIGSGRVIESTEKDTIFLFFSDHGTYGYLLFPEDRLSAEVLSKSIHGMIEKKRFNKMILYLEACHSGSMADDLFSANSTVLVVTASGRYESSLATYCQVPKLPCLGNAFSASVIWDLKKEFSTTGKTLFNQFDHVRTLTTKSHVNIYGDYRIGEELLENIFGKYLINERSFQFKTTNHPLFMNDLVKSTDASLHWMKKMSAYSPRTANANKYTKMVVETEKGREIINSIFSKIVEDVTKIEEEANNVIEGRHLINFDRFKCYEDLINIFSQRCVDIYKNSYTLSHLYKLYNLCLLENTHGNRILPKFMNAVTSVCDDQSRALAEID